MTIPEFERVLGEYELHAPVTLDDLAEIYADLHKQIVPGFSLDVVLRGTPDRRHDGDHRVEVTVIGGERVSRSIPVLA